MKNIMTVFCLSILIFISCSKDTKFMSTKADGKIQVQGITTYQYGTHVLIGGNGQTSFALKSDKIILNNYLNKDVEIVGHKIKGYPIDGGPDYLEVVSVREK